jgi:hypothetical protein
MKEYENKKRKFWNENKNKNSSKEWKRKYVNIVLIEKNII